MSDKLIPLSNADQIVSTYNDVLNDVSLAIELLKKAKLRLTNTFGEYHDDLFHDRISDYDFRHDGNGSFFENCKNTIKAEAWQFIADKVQIRTFLSIKRQEELDRQLSKEKANELPEVTEENIFQFINSTIRSAPDLVEEALQEVFEILRPHKNYHSFKTNSEFEIGNKVFFNYYMDTWYSNPTVNYHRHKELQAIDKLFHLMDGKPTPQYPDGIVTVIDTASREKKWNAETEYFKFSWYKKGSLHIEFKRLDLVAEINKRAGGMRLRG